MSCGTFRAYMLLWLAAKSSILSPHFIDTITKQLSHWILEEFAYGFVSFSHHKLQSGFLRDFSVVNHLWRNSRLWQLVVTPAAPACGVSCARTLGLVVLAPSLQGHRKRANLPENDIPYVEFFFLSVCQPHFSAFFFFPRVTTSGRGKKCSYRAQSSVSLRLSVTSGQERFCSVPQTYGCPRSHIKVTVPCHTSGFTCQQMLYVFTLRNLTWEKHDDSFENAEWWFLLIKTTVSLNFNKQGQYKVRIYNPLLTYTQIVFCYSTTTLSPE